MKCNICGHEATKGSIIFGSGFVCSEDCAQIARSGRKKFHDELNSEELCEMPDKLETQDFERWTLKFAVQYLQSISDADREVIANGNPIMLIPEELALDFKARILRHLHPAYHSNIQNRGHDRLFSDGTYCLRQPVPKEKIIEAAKKAQLIA
jgi:hypothetical protein